MSINLLNSRSRWSPEGRNLLNASGWEGYEDLDYRPERDGPDEAIPLPVRRDDPRHAEPVYYGAVRDGAMPVFKLGEVSSAPESLPQHKEAPTSNAAASTSTPVRLESLWRNVTGEGRREEGIPELPPWVKVGGQDNSGYAKMALARNNIDAAREIALKQFPGSTIRDDEYGNPVIRLPEGATRKDWRMTGSDSEGNPTFEASDVPISGEFYLNRPGLTPRDLANFAAEKMFTVAGGGIGGFVGAAAGMPIVGAGLGAGVGIEAMDAAAQQAGSSHDIDWVDAVEAAAGTAGFKGAKRLVRGWIGREG